LHKMHNLLRRLLNATRKLWVQTMKLNRRGKRVRAVLIYVLILSAIYGLSVAMGVWDIPESCLVDGVGCPEGVPAP
jgi:hypothetical protein